MDHARRKYQVFISSTYEDLREHREEIVRACLTSGNIPIGMEMFKASNADQWRVIQRTIDESDYYVVIVAHRYGSTIPEENGISFTEKEFDYAESKGIPILGFVIQDKAAWQPEYVDKGSKAKRLEAFKAKVRKRPVAHWSSKHELKSEFVLAFSDIVVQEPRVGWIPASLAPDPGIATELARLSSENERLRRIAAEDDAAMMEKLAAEVEDVRWTDDPEVSGNAMDLLWCFLRVAPEIRSGAELHIVDMAMLRALSSEGMQFNAATLKMHTKSLLRALDAVGLIDMVKRPDEGQYGTEYKDACVLSPRGVRLYRWLTLHTLDRHHDESASAGQN